MSYTNGLDKPAEYFETKLYTGTGATQSITGLNFAPDWVWIKGRSGATDHGLYDAVRGVQNQIESNTTTAETTEATGLTAFGTDGFTVGALAQLNTSSATYVAWNWKANGAGVSNTAGTISSTVSANTTSGFSIVGYTGNATAGATIGHGLGVTPKIILLKDRSGSDSWRVYTSTTGGTKSLYLNLTNAAATDSSIWNDTNPTSTVFTIGNDSGVNTSGNNYIAYCFADVKGYSKFGSYVGNGSTDGTFVYTGFKPAFVMMKSTNATPKVWVMVDNKRNTFNVLNTKINANDPDAEYSSQNACDFLSNGIKLRDNATNAFSTNHSGGTYIYMAFAEHPFVTSTSIPTTAR